MKTSPHVVIIGAGISGLTTAYWLRRSGIEVTVLEQEGSAGGTMQTVREDGWLIELGPNSALETTPLFKEMYAGLGIEKEHVYADPASDKRFILRGGRLHALPLGPGAFLRTGLWTASGKLRLLKEPFIGRAHEEESVAQFVERRLGREFLDYAINPFVAGVYAGDPGQLSVRSAFPKLYALEEKYGGLIKGMVMGARQRKQRAEKAKDRSKMFSFVEGMQTFPDAISRWLGNRVRVRCAVTALSRVNTTSTGVRGKYTITGIENGSPFSVVGDAVVVSVPAYAAAPLVRPLAAGLARVLEAIYYPPVAELFLGYASRQIARPLDGFGYLVPAAEKRQILGTIWSSSLFPGRAPAGCVALTTFVGGARQPELVGLDDTDLLKRVTGEIRSILGAHGEPVFSRIIRWNKAIPQYNLGYKSVLDAVTSFENEHPGLFFCSNFRGGIAVGDCVMNGKKTAERIQSDYPA
ncbi:MAG: protoporphyrinogen oxidase [Bacteroidetes bacterium]|jgi:oxygen-dependent protoporphyrinogen oxidase|nr:protoporphyrinogen oxidase [Bacteroidota bacterium]